MSGAADEASGNLIARWRAGEQQAASELFQRYADRLIALARSQLSANLARRVDAEDVVQSAYRSFFDGTRDGRYQYLGKGELWQLLVTIMLHKLQDQARRQTAGKRSLAAEQYFGSEDSLQGMGAAVGERQPSPAEALALVDEVEQTMRRLPPEHRRILELRLQGLNLYQIAVETHCCQRTVRRILEKIKRDIEQNKPR
jgi:RNA polymerase sigma-70 factor (ECF subfamily)